MYGKKADLKNCPFCGCELHRNWNSNGVFYEHPDNGCVFWSDKLQGSSDYKKWNARRGEKMVELQYMKGFVRENSFGNEVCREQLRCLWTAYCLHWSLDVDTKDYDINLAKLWIVMQDSELDTADWHDFDTFDNFMRKFLI